MARGGRRGRSGTAGGGRCIAWPLGQVGAGRGTDAIGSVDGACTAEAGEASETAGDRRAVAGRGRDLSVRRHARGARDDLARARRDRVRRDDRGPRRRVRPQRGGHRRADAGGAGRAALRRGPERLQRLSCGARSGDRDGDRLVGAGRARLRGDRHGAATDDRAGGRQRASTAAGAATGERTRAPSRALARPGGRARGPVGRHGAGGRGGRAVAARARLAAVVRAAPRGARGSWRTAQPRHRDRRLRTRGWPRGRLLRGPAPAPAAASVHRTGGGRAAGDGPRLRTSSVHGSARRRRWSCGS